MADPSSTVSGALIGEIFVERGHITPAELEEALAAQAETGELLGEILVSRYNVPRVELAGVLAEQWATMERGGGVTPNAPIAEAAASFAAEPQSSAVSPSDLEFERRPIGEIFVEQGVVTPAQLEAALSTQSESGQRLGEVLVAQGVITRLELASALADQWSTLQKIRPPEPKPVEPWQELAVRGVASSDDDVDHESGQALSSTPYRYEASAEVEGLRDAVRALEERLRLVTSTSQSTSPTQLPDEALRELNATFERRLEELAQQFDEALTADIALVRGAMDELRESTGSPTDDGRLVALEQRLESAVDGLLARIDGVTSVNAPTEELDNLRANVAGLEHRLVDAPTRDEIDALRIAFGAVSEDVKRLAEVPSGITHDELQRHLASVAADLGARLDTLAATTTASPALADVHQQLGGLAEQVAEIARTGQPTDVADRLSSLGFRVDQVEESLASAAADATALRAALDVERSEREAVAARLDQTTARLAAIDELSERVDGLGEGPARFDATIGEIDSRVTLLAGTVAALPTADRVGSLEEAVTGLAELRARVDRLDEAPARSSSADVSALASRLDALAEQLDAASEASRLDELELSVETLRSVESGQLDNLRAAVKELSDGLRELSARPAGVAQEDLDRQLAAIRARLDEVEALHASPLRGPEDVILEQVDALVAGERSAREELEARVAELGNGMPAVEELRRELAAVAAGHGIDELARDAVQQLRERLEEIGERVGDRGAIDALRAQVADLAVASANDNDRLHAAQLRERVEALAAQLGDVGRPAELLEELRARVEGLATDYGARLHAVESVDGRLGELENRLASDHQLDAEQLSARLAALDDVHARLDEIAATTGADDAVRRELVELRERFDTLAEQGTGDELDAVRQRIDSLAELGADTASRLEALRGRLEELAPTTGIDELAREGVAELRTRLAEARDDEGPLAQIVELRARVDEISTRATVDDVARGGLDELRGTVERLDGAQSDTATRGEVTDLTARLAEVAGRLDSLAHVDWVAGIERSATEAAGALHARLDAVESLVANGGAAAEDLGEARAALAQLDARLQGLAHAVDETRGGLNSVDGNVAATLEAAVKDMVSAGTVAEIAEQIHVRLAAIESAATPTHAALDELGMRLGAAEQRAWALPEELDDRFARMHQELSSRIEALSNGQSHALSSLHARFDEAVGLDQGRLAALEESTSYASSRLDGVEARLAESNGSVSERVDALEVKLEVEAKRAEERGKATEKAIRKGLAGLAERLAANEDAYLESGKALRRAIERLGAAVIEADTRIAGMPLDAPDSGYVAFVPTADGYRLRPLDGLVPIVGDEIDLGEDGGRLRVSRIATSPLPLDRRACAYLERV